MSNIAQSSALWQGTLEQQPVQQRAGSTFRTIYHLHSQYRVVNKNSVATFNSVIWSKEVNSMYHMRDRYFND